MRAGAPEMDRALYGQPLAAAAGQKVILPVRPAQVPVRQDTGARQVERERDVERFFTSVCRLAQSVAQVYALCPRR